MLNGAFAAVAISLLLPHGPFILAGLVKVSGAKRMGPGKHVLLQSYRLYEVFVGNPFFSSSGRHRPRGLTTPHQSISAVVRLEM